MVGGKKVSASVGNKLLDQYASKYTVKKSTPVDPTPVAKVADPITQPVKDEMSIADQAKFGTFGQYDLDEDLTDELSGMGLTGDSYSTMEDYLKGITKGQERELSNAEKQDAMARQVEQSQLDRAKESGEASGEGVAASVLGGREGMLSKSNPMVVQQFKARTEKILGESRTRVASAQASRTNAIASLKQAQKSNNTERIRSLQTQIANAESDIRAEQITMADQARADMQLALQFEEAADNRGTMVADNLAAMGAAAGNITPDQLFTMTQGTNLTMPQALALQSAAVLEGEALTTKNEAEAEYKMQQVNKLRAEAKVAGKTTAQQEYEYMSTLGDAEQSQFMELKRANPNMQFYQQDDGSILAADPATGKVMKTFAPAGDGDFEGKWGTSTDAINVPDGKPIDPTTGEPAVDSWNGKVGSMQCGQFVNSYTGLSMGDTYDSKISAISGSEVDTPQVGDVFVSPYKDIGHSGFVTGVSADGKQVTVKDANWDGKTGQIGTHTMNVDDMRFARPASDVGIGGEFGYLKQQYEDKGYEAEDAAMAAQTQIDDWEFDRKKLEGQVLQYDITVREIDEVLSSVEDSDWFKTGLTGALTSWIPGTAGKDIDAKMETIKANIGFAQLQEMRNASKTGGALGQVSEMENKLLQSVKGSLDTGVSGDAFIDSLKQVRENLVLLNDTSKEAIAGGATGKGTAEERESDQDSAQSWYDSYQPLYEEYGI